MDRFRPCFLSIVDRIHVHRIEATADPFSNRNLPKPLSCIFRMYSLSSHLEMVQLYNLFQTHSLGYCHRDVISFRRVGCRPPRTTDPMAPAVRRCLAASTGASAPAMPAPVARVRRPCAGRAHAGVGVFSPATLLRKGNRALSTGVAVATLPCLPFAQLDGS